MSVQWNGHDMTCAQYRALKIDRFLDEAWVDAQDGTDIQSAALLHLISQLLPGDGVSTTTYLTRELQEMAFCEKDLKGAILGLFGNFVASPTYRENTRTVQHVPDSKLENGLSVTRVLQSEWDVDLY